MPRRSADFLALGSYAGVARLLPPSDLSAIERRIWLKITNSLPGDHFKAEDSQILAAYCSAIAQQRQAARELAHRDRYDRARILWTRQHSAAVLAITKLAIRLRLGPKARDPNNRRRNATALTQSASAYEFLGDGDNDGAGDADAAFVARQPRNFADLRRAYQEPSQPTEESDGGI